MFSSDIYESEIKVEEISRIYDLSGFDCEDKDLNEFLKKDSFKYKKSKL